MARETESVGGINKKSVKGAISVGFFGTLAVYVALHRNEANDKNIESQVVNTYTSSGEIFNADCTPTPYYIDVDKESLIYENQHNDATPISLPFIGPPIPPEIAQTQAAKDC